MMTHDNACKEIIRVVLLSENQAISSISCEINKLPPRMMTHVRYGAYISQAIKNK